MIPKYLQLLASGQLFSDNGMKEHNKVKVAAVEKLYCVL
jgi:hypothetical protein